MTNLPRLPRIVILRLALAVLLLGCVINLAALAHHPGSHAWREGARVRLEAVATATDGCTFIGAVTAGAPPQQVAPADAFPVTVRLRRPADAQVCTLQVRALRDETMLDVPPKLRKLHLFILKPDGSLMSTERVTIN